MRKLRLFSVIFLILILSSCSVQKRVSPEILISRIEKHYPEYVFENAGYYLNNYFYVFAVFNGSDIAFKIAVDENNTANKISLSFEMNDNISEISDIITPVIEAFSPDEDCKKITEELMKNEEGFFYSFGKEHSYSFAVNRKNAYFEVFNNRLSDYTVPELTLKQNDRITY